MKPRTKTGKIRIQQNMTVVTQTVFAKYIKLINLHDIVYSYK